MAATTGSKDQQPSTGAAPGAQPAAGGSLTLNLSSNNPFRNRAVSPSLNSPGSPFDDPSPRPVSRNPFLDPALNGTINKSNNIPADKMAATGAPAPQTEGKKSPTAAELFDSLTLDDKKSAPPPSGAPPPYRRGPPPPGRENMPPPGARRGPPSSHRPTRSQEEAMRARRMQGSGSRGPKDSSRSPQRVPRARRNSESSAVSADKPPLTEEEKKARDARRRERERRHREGRDKSATARPGRRLDIIDKLDATSIFGTGLFHHDGPFDALNPHRNRNGSRRAPMQAFPKDSLNNVIGGSGPLNARPDHATFLGHNDGEAFRDYASGTVAPPAPIDGTRAPKEVGGVFDPLSRGSVLHGDETLGLGTSTFLEGTPATRTAIQKREEEQQAAVVENGLARKKSLAQRIRNINRNGPREGFQPSGRMTNPEGVYASRRSPPTSPPIGGANTSNSLNERNPFFNEFETGKGEEQISIRRTESNGNGPKSPTSPRRERGGSLLERRVTSEGAAPAGGEDDAARQGGGLLARVKSLKGGGRRKPPVPNAAPPGAGGRASDEYV